VPDVAADLQSDANYYKDFQSVKTITLRNKTPRQPFMVNSPVAADLQSDANYYKDFQSVKQ
jgi:hypothetical protein